MKTFKLTEQLGQELLNYLASRPYAEVFQLVQKLQTLEEIKEDKEKEKK